MLGARERSLWVMVRWAMLGTAAVVLTVGAVAGGASRSRASLGSSTLPRVVGSGRLPAPRDGSFLSLWPACGCSRKLVLEQFSLANGRRLGVVARVSRSPVTVSDPHVGPDGEVWLTFSSGPRYRSDVAGGDPAPDSCSGRAVRFDPFTQRTTTALTFPSSQLIADVIPSPVRGRAVTVGGGCATSFFNEHLVVRDLHTGKHWSIGADAAPCHALSTPSWSRNGSQLVFAYGPSTLSAQARFNPSGCPAPRASRLAVVPAGHTTPISSWTLTPPDGLQLRGGCLRSPRSRGDRDLHPRTIGWGSDLPTLGNTYLVQLNREWRIDRR